MLVETMQHTPDTAKVEEQEDISLVGQLSRGIASNTRSSCRGREEGLSAVDKPPSKKQRVAKKTVRIVEQENELYYFPYDKEDTNNAWMQESDFSAIKQGNRQTILTILRLGGEMSKINVHDFCVRGLEDHIEMLVVRTKRDRRKKIINRVLSDQKTQRLVGVRDAEMLSKVYGHLCQYSTRRALELAYVDALR